ncbi:hypothetical protein ACFQZQ_10935 [Lysobacter koreensis]|uniref:Uncharacterized protein n=1 Tax=Lysobacter koreensis TaxID=266122 RepID=A0ABW2YPJ3_9GAMM
MNATISLPAPTPASAQPANVVTMPARHVHRARDFGVGYGNSSGYASDRKYVSQWAPPRFKFA